MTDTLDLATDILWLDDLLESETLTDIEKQLVKAIDKDRTLHDLVIATPILRAAIVRAVMKCLHVDPLAVLADGWCAARDIRACRNADKATGKPVVLKLGLHSISRDMRPAIIINLGSEKRFTLGLTLGLAGIFEGVELTISESKLVSVGSGTCNLSLQIKVAGRTVISRTLKTLALPGEYRFAEPIVLR